MKRYFMCRLSMSQDKWWILYVIFQKAKQLWQKIPIVLFYVDEFVVRLQKN
jgi:hypothetical protein